MNKTQKLEILALTLFQGFLFVCASAINLLWAIQPHAAGDLVRTVVLVSRIAGISWFALANAIAIYYVVKVLKNERLREKKSARTL